MLESTIEYNKDKILDFLNDFDNKAKEILKNFDLTETQIKKKFKQCLDKDIQQVDYSQEIQINDAFKETPSLFASNYFSAFIEIYANNQPKNTNLSKIIKAFLQILIGCYGSKSTSNLNEVFNKSPKLPLFDDLCNDFYGIFRIDLSRAGLAAVELALDNDSKTISLDQKSQLENIFEKLGLKIIEKLFEQTLDYKQLVDSYFRYLYEPKVEWAKFTKMAIFLETVRTYINKHIKEAHKKQNGYYHDLLREMQNISVTGIGTTNYTNLINSIIKDVHPAYLNGSVDDFYDPYLNKMIEFNSEEERLQHPHLTIPLIFTQSGIKPLTSIEMSRRYVNLYDKFCDSEAIVIVGYGFNDDDGHINGLFRDLIQDKGKDLFIIRRQNDKSKEDIKKECANKLRIDLTDKLNIILVDNNRKEKDVLWCKKVTKIIFDKRNKNS